MVRIALRPPRLCVGVLSTAAPASPVAPEVDVEVLEEEADETAERLDLPWRVILFNDDIHTFDEVILQLVKAIGCPTHRALRLAMEAHFKGKAKVYEGTFEDCFRVQGVLREIQLVTEIEG